MKGIPMPIYEYSCHHCSHHFEVLQKVSDEALPICPACQSEDVQRWVSAAGFQLKGTGWYATDFKQSGKPKDDPKSKEAEKPASTEAASSEAKPAASQTDKSSSKAE